jgi:hypothetical protein
MLALIAAMTIAAAAPEPAAEPSASRVQLVKPPLLGTLQPDQLAARRHCKDAARFQTGFEPALLFREQDRPNARARRLIDLPNGAYCLVGEAQAVRDVR